MCDASAVLAKELREADCQESAAPFNLHATPVASRNAEEIQLRVSHVVHLLWPPRELREAGCRESQALFNLHAMPAASKNADETQLRVRQCDACTALPKDLREAGCLETCVCRQDAGARVSGREYGGNAIVLSRRNNAGRGQGRAMVGIPLTGLKSAKRKPSCQVAAGERDVGLNGGVGDVGTRSAQREREQPLPGGLADEDFDKFLQV